MQKGAIVLLSAILLRVSHIKPYSLSRKEILRGQKNFKLFLALGTRLRTSALTLQGLRFTLCVDDYPLKVAFQVSRRVMRRAVDRRRTLRLLREAYRLQKPDFLAHHPGGELWLFWQWQQPTLPSLAQLKSLMRELYLRFLQLCAS